MREKILFENVKILDCTVRDGGICNDWHFSKEFVSKVYSAVAETGIYCCELGYVTKKGTFKEDTGIWRYTNEEEARAVVTPGYHTKVSIMGDIGRIAIDNFKDKEDSIVDVVRLACYKTQLDEVVELAEQVVDKGYEVSINLMAITSYEPKELEDAMPLLYDSRADIITLADSYGALLPDDVESLIKLFKKGTGKMIGFHAHNNLELAFANTIRAVEAGAGIVDGSIYGIGRGAGNLPLEVILSYISHHEDGYINMVPLLELIEEEFLDLKKKLNWGYNLHYMLSGMLKCHPYYAAELLETHKFDMKDVWSTLIKISAEKPMKFDKKLMETAIAAKAIPPGESKTPKVDFSKITPTTVNLSSPDYLNRHNGKDFLVLAQGPSLKKHIKEIKEFAKKKKLVVLGANYLHGLIVPDYHAFCSMSRFLQYVDFVDSKSKLLLGAYISENIAKNYTKREFETIPYVDDSSLEFDIDNGIIQTNCGTVSVMLIGVAIAMGARKIYVAGMDGYKHFEGKGTHFYSESVKVPHGNELNALHNVCNTYLSEIRKYQRSNELEPFEIITPTSYSDFYKKPEDF